jgi:hypothetical protein
VPKRADRDREIELLAKVHCEHVALDQLDRRLTRFVWISVASYVEHSPAEVDSHDAL